MEYEQNTGEARELRDSVFLHATVTATHGEASGVFRIRNISSGGLMAEGPVSFHAGDELDIDLRNVGTVHGRVAWAAEGRFGIMFDRLIDPKVTRMPVAGGGREAPEPILHRPIRPLFPDRGRQIAM